MTVSARNFILQLLQERGPIPAGDIDAYNYIDSGHIDSLGLIKFFMRIENQFGIELSSEEMSATSIRTVGGITALIASKSTVSQPTASYGQQPCSRESSPQD